MNILVIDDHTFYIPFEDLPYEDSNGDLHFIGRVKVQIEDLSNSYSTQIRKFEGVTNRHAYIHSLSVKDGYKQFGLGTALMERVLEHVDCLNLIPILKVNRNNSAAINLYNKLGFIVSGVHNESLIMQKLN
jgi:ribosomal protein S18 acetylase RimI-like enzyme